MGSSKSGSLDGLAKFSLPAAIGAGKIKLPETGIVGMLQARQEDKMNKGAQMAQQDDNQMTQYMKMMQQQMNPGMNMGGRVGLIDTAVKSVTWETQIVLIENGKPLHTKIGEWIDNKMDNVDNVDTVYTEYTVCTVYTTCTAYIVCTVHTMYNVHDVYI